MTRASATDYPVGAPVRPGAEAATQVARLKRWTYALLGAAGLLLLAAAAAGVFGFDLAGRYEPRAADGEEKAAREQLAAAQARVDQLAKSEKAAKEELAGSQDRVDRLLGALGGMGGSHLYQFFVNLELLADSVEGGIYSKAEGDQKLRLMLGMMDQVDGHLQKLQAAGLPADEQAGVNALRKLSAAVRREADALQAFWKTGAREQEVQYQAAHEAALTALSDWMKK